MNKIISLIVIIFFLSCSFDKNKNDNNDDFDFKNDMRNEVENKYDLYLNYIDNSKRDSNGWLEGFKCDALLFNSLASYAGIKDIVIDSAKDDKNKWYRTPYKNCYPENSKSTISRDMFIGLYYYILKYKRIDLIEEIIDYGLNSSKNNKIYWIMGDGDKSRIIFNPIFISTTYHIKHYLNSKDSDFRKIPFIYSKKLKGYEAHLHVLHIYLRYLANKKISQKAIDVLGYYAKNQPRNALFTAIYSKFNKNYVEKAYASLLDTSLFPSDSLPTTKNYCDEYIFQRDQFSNAWKPCLNGKIKKHIPVDFILAAAILLNK